MILPFPGSPQTTSSAAGGKAASLIRMCEAGLPIPPGVVITSAFFTPWFDEIASSATWNALVGASPDEWPPLCHELKRQALKLSLTDAQHDALENLLRRLRRLPPVTDRRCYAVRSSSPEEDSTSASFAGVYETRLGVAPADVGDAVRACFASSLDARVFIYKRERGLDEWTPRIAVVVQQQIDSDVAGVGFSLNPVTNDYDEVVIDANWGLGSSVVEGRVSPDHFVVNTVERHVVEEIRGDKRMSVWLAADGRTVERANERPVERALTDAQIGELTNLIGRIEKLYEKPIDVEWAYADGALYVLQARPITSYVPLPPSMVTEPGERRRLYGDASLSKGLTTNAPISPLGLDIMERMFSAIMESWVGPLNMAASREDALFVFSGGRMYVDYSGILWLASPAKLAKGAAPTDALMARTLAEVDPKRYRAAARPSWAGIGLLWRVPRIVWNLRGFFWNLLRALLFPERAYRAYRRWVDAFEIELREQLDDGLPLDDLRRTYQSRMVEEMFDVVMPTVVAGMVSAGSIVSGRSAEAKRLADRLTRGAGGNVVVEMGIALYRLAALLDQFDLGDLDRADLDDLDSLAERIEQRQMPAPFLKAWDDFISRFGWRGPLETDPASPRYADDPRLALRQMSVMAVDDERFNPEAAHRRQVEERRRAREQLMRMLGPLRRVLLRRICRLSDLFAGTRDTPKHLLVLFNYAIRKRALAEGRRLAREGRLNAAQDVFNLTFAELQAASLGAGPSLRDAFEERMRFRRKLAAHVRAFPGIIDSRGRILRPTPREAEPGLLTGMPVSPGVVTGPVKVIHDPREKHVEKGDVLVAYTTDPGWTPLFVNAAAVVLEVGGVLQHGAVVAREYGKPCVVGIDSVVTTLCDGELVEVDGTMGTVRRLS